MPPEGERGRQRALELAFRHVARRERTVAELRAHLESRDIDREDAEAAVSTLIADGYLDDARYARLFVEDRRALAGWGSERIARALSVAGVDPEIAAAALAREDPGEEMRAARELLRRRLPEPSGDPAERQRALGLLVRRGYELELAHDALRAHTGSAHDDEGC